MFERNVIVRIDGGLGSQLFQFAAGYALAQHLDCDLLLEVSFFARNTARRYCLDALDIPQTSIERPPARVRSRWLQVGLQAVAMPPCYHYRERYLHFDRMFFGLKAPVFLEGYFLSERYFAPVGHKLRHLLTLKEALSPAGAEIDATIADNPMAVSVHVRRDDLVQSQYRPPLDLSYFHRADQLISALLPRQPQYFIFSDDYDYAAQAFDSLPNKVVVRGDSSRPWEDMVLMSRCRHHITANSALSWWAAWLNPRQDKIVIAPRHWFMMDDSSSTDEIARWNAMDLYPRDWILI